MVPIRLRASGASRPPPACARRRYESTRSTRRKDAVKLLNDRMSDIGKGVVVTPQIGRLTLADVWPLSSRTSGCAGARRSPRPSNASTSTSCPTSAPATAWHCCLEFFSVATRLPPEFRLTAGDAVRLVQEEVFGRMSVHDLPASDRASMLRTLAQDGVTGGRIYDVHIAEVARAAGAKVVVTDNRRHFLAALRHGLRVETPAEFLESLKARRG